MTRSYLDLEQREAVLKAINVDLRTLVTESINEYLTKGTQLLVELLMQAEVETLCGTRHQHSKERKYLRWGDEVGSALIDGAKRTVKRPRVRAHQRFDTAEGEVQLETYKAMNSKELMDGPLSAAIFSGVSTRNYQKIVARGLEAKGVSKSAVSRKAIAATKPTVDQFRQRRIDDLDLVVLFFDGVHVAKRQIVVCVGVDVGGKKHVLATQNGASENEIVCRDLIYSLKEKGLDTEQKYLFVIDGSKALAKAIRCAFGPNAAIQRCQEHKIRNVQAYIPRKLWGLIRTKMTAAYNEPTEKQASQRLMELRSELIPISEGAVNALTEGLNDTLTLHRLKVTGSLRTSIRTTNAIESAFSSVRRYMRNANKFRDEAQIELWLSRSLLEAETHFRILKGHRQLKTLKRNLLSYKLKKDI
jgi:putative transposase